MREIFSTTYFFKQQIAFKMQRIFVFYNFWNMIYDPHKNGKPSTLPVSPIFVPFFSHFLFRLCPDFNINTRISYTLVLHLFSCTYKLYFYTGIVPYETFIALFVNNDVDICNLLSNLWTSTFYTSTCLVFGFNLTDLTQRRTAVRGMRWDCCWLHHMRSHTISYRRISPRKGVTKVQWDMRSYRLCELLLDPP